MPAFWTHSRSAVWSAALIAGAVSIAWASNPAQASPKEEALLTAKDAKDVVLYRRSEVSRQISYTMDLAYPARAIGEPQWEQLKRDGWIRCRSIDPDQEVANADWVNFGDASVTPKRTVHQHLTHWFKDNQMIMISLRYYSSTRNEQPRSRPDNTEQRVAIVFEDERGREWAEWLKLDCSQ